MPDDPSTQPRVDSPVPGGATRDNRADKPDDTSPFVPLRQPVFRAMWTANLVSSLGGMIQAVAAGWLMTSLAGSPDMVALVQGSISLPIMMFSLVAGAISDNFDRRQVMLVAQVFMFLVSLLLVAMAWFGLITAWLLLALTFLIGCGTALNGPAWQSSVGEMVPRKDLPAAITLNGVGFNIARSFGPALGGVIVAGAGVVFSFALNALSYIGLIIVLMRWKPPKVERVLPRETLGIAMSAGLRYVGMSPNIRAVLFRGAVFGFGAIALQALGPLVARDLVAGGPLTYGLLLGAFGAGAVGGPLAAARLRRTLSTEALIRLAFAMFAVATALAGMSRHTVLTMAAMLIAGLAWVPAFSTFNATVQLSAPRWVVGRALALYQTATFGGMAFGSWVWGYIASHVGTAQSLSVAAVALAVGAAVGLRYALPRLEQLNLDPLRRWQVPKVAVDIEPRSGPIFVTVEYIIREEDIVPFLNVMAERRRVRRRDGARHWTLLRDLTDSRLWIERYDCPTWVEYIRQNQRITQADADIGDHIRALHQGPNPPVVHRVIERRPGALHHSRTRAAMKPESEPDQPAGPAA